MAKIDRPVKIYSVDVADALRAALAMPLPEDAIDGAQRDWDQEKPGGWPKGKPRPKKKKPQSKKD